MGSKTVGDCGLTDARRGCTTVPSLPLDPSPGVLTGSFGAKPRLLGPGGGGWDDPGSGTPAGKNRPGGAGNPAGGERGTLRGVRGLQGQPLAKGLFLPTTGSVPSHIGGRGGRFGPVWPSRTKRPSPVGNSFKDVRAASSEWECHFPVSSNLDFSKTNSPQGRANALHGAHITIFGGCNFNGQFEEGFPHALGFHQTRTFGIWAPWFQPHCFDFQLKGVPLLDWQHWGELLGAAQLFDTKGQATREVRSGPPVANLRQLEPCRVIGGQVSLSRFAWENMGGPPICLGPVWLTQRGNFDRARGGRSQRPRAKKRLHF